MTKTTRYASINARLEMLHNTISRAAELQESLRAELSQMTIETAEQTEDTMSLRNLQRVSAGSFIGECECGLAVILTSTRNTCDGCDRVYNVVGQEMKPPEEEDSDDEE